LLICRLEFSEFASLEFVLADEDATPSIETTYLFAAEILVRI
jgi:hypothetical protein